MIIPTFVNKHRQGILLLPHFLAGRSAAHFRQVDLLCVRQPEPPGTAGGC